MRRSASIPETKSFPRVSVVIPAYNQADFVSSTIESVLAQTSSPFEIIVVDDGSTDRTADVVRSFGDAIHYTFQANAGLSSARNTGISLAKGEFVCFLDSDDLWMPAFVEHMAQRLDTNPKAGAVGCGHRMIDLQGMHLSQTGRPDDGQRYDFTAFSKGNPFPVHAMLVRRSCLEEIGGFDEDLSACEDWDMWMRLSSRYPVVTSRALLALYRVNPGSMSSDQDRMLTNRLAVLRKHFDMPEDQIETWSWPSKDAYGRALCATVIEFLQVRDLESAASLLAKAYATAPWLAEDRDIFYELALGDQPRGIRGSRNRIEIEECARGLNELLDLVQAMGIAEPKASNLIDKARVTAMLSLSKLAYLVGDQAKTKRLLRRALSQQPHLIADSSVLGLLLRCYLHFLTPLVSEAKPKTSG